MGRRRVDAVPMERHEIERTAELEQVRLRLFPDLAPEQGWKQIEAALEGSLDAERWRRIEQLAEADIAADLAARLPTRGADDEPSERRHVERAERFRMVWWRVDTLIEAGYAPEQAGQLGRDLEISVPEAVDLLRSGVPAADATARLLRHTE